MSVSKPRWVFFIHMGFFLIHRGRGPLKNTMDVIGAAKKISEVGSNLDKLANSIADEVGGVLFVVLGLCLIGFLTIIKPTVILIFKNVP